MACWSRRSSPLLKRLFKMDGFCGREVLPAAERLRETADNRSPRACGRMLARFSFLYASRDERLLLFEDGDGHLVAVDSSHSSSSTATRSLSALRPPSPPESSSLMEVVLARETMAASMAPLARSARWRVRRAPKAQTTSRTDSAQVKSCLKRPFYTTFTISQS